MWHPKASDLYAYIEARMEQAYQERERPRCSREDFFDGYIAALRDHLPRSAFKPEAVASKGQSEAEHAISVSVLRDGRYRALCSCGLKGIRTEDRRIAEIRAEQHLAYTREVSALTSRPAHRRPAAETGEG